MYRATLYDTTVNVYNYIDARPLISGKLEKSVIKNAGKNKPKYHDIIATFDIETTTVKNDGPEKREQGKYSHFNYPFHWQLCFGGILVTGRYIGEFFDLMDWASGIAKGAKILCYIHNAAFEYNNLAEYFIEHSEDPEKDFFFKTRVHPLKITNGAIEYRCSYQLTHKSLAILSGEIGLEKGSDFDYTIPRHSETPLCPEEVEYCLRDVWNLYLWLLREIERYSKSINKKTPHPCYMPLTQTGYVRHDIRTKWSNTRNGRLKLHDLRMNEYQYNLCREAFRGGDTHASYRKLCKRLHNVKHRDFVSAYPAVMVMEEFPMKAWKEVGKSSIIDVNRYVKQGKAVIGLYDFRNVELRPGHTSYIAKSCCRYISSDAVIENGRVMQAKQVLMVITEIDLMIILNTYSTTISNIDCVITARKQRLPKAVVNVILDYYYCKTAYKNVQGLEDEYALSKQKLNGIYGCSATSLVHSVLTVNPETLETLELPGEYEESKVLPYQWAPYITAYVRRNLSRMKYRLDNDFDYCDTDSIFYEDNADVEKYIDDYNSKCVEILKSLCSVYDPEKVIPKDPAGKCHYLGTFESESDVDTFITVGAKRYVTQIGERVEMTFSGVTHTKMYSEEGRMHMGHNTKYIADHYGNGDIFSAFENFPDHSIFIPFDEKYGKMTHYVERGDFVGTIDDGHTTQTVTARSSMVLVPVATTLSLDRSLFDLFFNGGIITV